MTLANQELHVPCFRHVDGPTRASCDTSVFSFNLSPPNNRWPKDKAQVSAILPPDARLALSLAARPLSSPPRLFLSSSRFHIGLYFRPFGTGLQTEGRRSGN